MSASPLSRSSFVWQDLMAPGRRVLSHDAMIDLGQKLLSLAPPSTHRVVLEHVAHSVTKVANSTVLGMEDGDVIHIQFPSKFGSGLDVAIHTNQFDAAMLQRVIDEARAILPRDLPKPDTDDRMPDEYGAYSARPLPPVALYHDASARVMDTVRGEVIPQMVGQLRGSGLTGAATVGLMARSTLHLYREGLSSFAEETDCEVSATARTPDGKASGWSGQARRNWSGITPSAVTTQAIDIANRMRGAVAMEPGRRTAILAPAAVAQLVYTMAPSFDFNGARQNNTPLGFRNLDPKGRHTKLGLPIFDRRLMMVSDPADPDGGFPPFFEVWGKSGLTGFPTPAVTWIDRGVLTRMSMDVPDAVARDLTPAEDPYCVRLAPAPDVQTATLEEMIANCREGIYVNRFSDVYPVDWASGTMSGVTRDGCFLIKNGKITKPLANLRFTDSPFFAFNQLEMIGKAERAAFGGAPTRLFTWLRRGLPRFPVIVPPMMVRDFNFSALATAV